MTDRIIIKDLEVHFRVGVTEEERALVQRLLMTLELELDLRPAGASDDLAATVDYARVCDEIRAMGEGREWRLIESLAQDVVERVWGWPLVRGVRLEIRKFVLPETSYVGVRICRRREEG